AFTSFSLNLYREVFFPAMSMVSQVTPGPFETRPAAPLHQPIAPTITYEQILQQAHEEGEARNWERPPAGIFYARSLGFYSVAFFHPGADHGSGGMRSEEHTSELQSRENLVCRLLLEKKKK